jgi:integrase
MAVYDQWHTRKQPFDPGTGQAVPRCGQHSTAHADLYPTRAHGKGKRWQVRWRDEAGNQQKRNFAKKDGKDISVHAEAFDADITAKLNSGTYVDPDAGNITLQAYATQWRSGLTADLSSLEATDKQLRHVADLYGRKMRPLSKSPSTIRQWIAGLQAKGLSPGYIKVIVGTLSSIFNAAVDDGIIQRNPCRSRSVRPPTVPARQVRPWTLEMVEAARAEVQRRQNSPAIVDLAAMAGLRESEVFGFAEEDIEFLGRDRQIRVRRQIKRIGKTLYFCLPKGGKERTVPLSETLAIRLAEQIRLRPPVEVELPWGTPDGPARTYRLLFTAPNGLPWYRQTFSHTWTAARKAAGAPPPPDENGRFHGLRHTYASVQLAAGADIRKLAAWLGHGDPGFTLRTYTHLMPDTADVGRRAVDEFFRGKIVPPGALDVPSDGG